LRLLLAAGATLVLGAGGLVLWLIMGVNYESNFRVSSDLADLINQAILEHEGWPHTIVTFGAASEPCKLSNGGSIETPSRLNWERYIEMCRVATPVGVPNRCFFRVLGQNCVTIAVISEIYAIPRFREMIESAISEPCKYVNQIEIVPQRKKGYFRIWI
jgi:hypothetical protein